MANATWSRLSLMVQINNNSIIKHKIYFLSERYFNESKYHLYYSVIVLHHSNMFTIVFT